MESAGAKTINFKGQSHPVCWEVTKITANSPFVPTFGVFDSEVTMTDANIKRIIHEVDI